MTDTSRINTFSHTADPTFISVDLEYTGQSPADGEICSIGAIPLVNNFSSYEPDEDNTFYVNLEFEHPKVFRSNPETMDWWAQFPQQWEEHRANTVPILQGIRAFAEWAKTVSTKPIFVAWPAAADWQFVNYYMYKYLGENPFGYSPVCIKNFALGVLHKPLALLGHREEAHMPDSWLIEPEQLGLRSHIALDDAIAQAYMLRQILLDMKSGTFSFLTTPES